MSAPVLLGHRRASSSKRMSRSHDMVRVWICGVWGRGGGGDTAGGTMEQSEGVCSGLQCEWGGSLLGFLRI
jgi:hypothetical protein